MQRIIVERECEEHENSSSGTDSQHQVGVGEWLGAEGVVKVSSS